MHSCQILFAFSRKQFEPLGRPARCVHHSQTNFGVELAGERVPVILHRPFRVALMHDRINRNRSFVGLLVRDKLAVRRDPETVDSVHLFLSHKLSFTISKSIGRNWRKSLFDPLT